MVLKMDYLHFGMKMAKNGRKEIIPKEILLVNGSFGMKQE